VSLEEKGDEDFGKKSNKQVEVEENGRGGL